jgi:hypothetical protein
VAGTDPRFLSSFFFFTLSCLNSKSTKLVQLYLASSTVLKESDLSGESDVRLLIGDTDGLIVEVNKALKGYTEEK